jgi:hypothetical protein
VSFKGQDAANQRPVELSKRNVTDYLIDSSEGSVVFDAPRRSVPGEDTGDANAMSVCFGLDDDSATYGGGSVAMTLCNTKKLRTEITAV